MLSIPGPITVPNIISFIRILTAVAALVVIRDDRYAAIAAWMLILASVLDYFDGWYARRYNQETGFGAHLDPFADKVLVAVTFIVLCDALQLRWFNAFVAVILAREAVMVFYRPIVAMRRGNSMAAGRFGKVKTTVQYLVGDAMLFHIFIYPGKIPESNWLIFAGIVATALITVDSGLRYMLPVCRDGKKRSMIERLLQFVSGVMTREARDGNL